LYYENAQTLSSSENWGRQMNEVYKISESERRLFGYWVSGAFADRLREIEGKEFESSDALLEKMRTLATTDRDLERLNTFSSYVSWCRVRKESIDDRESKLCITNSICSGCPEPNFFMRLLKIEEEEGHWKAEGDGWHRMGNLESRKEICHGCGNIYMKILYKPPIVTEPFSCPKCGGKEKLLHSVKHLYLLEEEFDKLEFQFEVEIVCEKCNKKRFFVELIRDIMKIAKIEIGPGGIKLGKV
jgi:DNA-directed RNA polymerase subunit RPC12/RpoP